MAATAAAIAPPALVHGEGARGPERSKPTTSTTHQRLPLGDHLGRRDSHKGQSRQGHAQHRPQRL